MSSISYPALNLKMSYNPTTKHIVLNILGEGLWTLQPTVYRSFLRAWLLKEKMHEANIASLVFFATDLSEVREVRACSKPRSQLVF